MSKVDFAHSEAEVSELASSSRFLMIDAMSWNAKILFYK